MRNIDRRTFLRLSSILASSVIVSCAKTSTKSISTPSSIDFTHSVASGDPTQSAVIIWTRAVPVVKGANTATVNWQVATDQSFNNIVRSGSANTSSARDYTIKIDVTELSTGQRYYYRFIGDNITSPVGVTKTLPKQDVSKITFAVFSCSNYPAGYFTPYTLAANQGDFDFVLHLGDYIYEYAADGYATEKAVEIGRAPNANNISEVISLADYRNRYALYRNDRGLQAIHQSAPFIVVWDDHEIANDTWKAGAQNHNEDEGDFFERRTAAVQAYYEWLPIRPPAGESSPQIYRSFDFGELLSLHMLDTRVIGRDKQLAYADYMSEQGQMDAKSFTQDISNPDRTLLGSQQLAWLQKNVARSSAKWQMLGQQVLMGKMFFPAEVMGNRDRTKTASMIANLSAIKLKQADGQTLTEKEQARLSNKIAYNLDAWDGYPAEREKLYSIIKQMNKQLVVVAGDTHNAWCSQLTNSAGEVVGYEYATPSVSSPGMEAYLSLSVEEAKKLADDLVAVIDDLQYCNLHERGFLKLEITMDDVQANWLFVDTVLQKQSEIAHVKTILQSSLKT
jgi:alkaline phosphatase D